MPTCRRILDRSAPAAAEGHSQSPLRQRHWDENELRALVLGLLFVGGATVGLIALALPQAPQVDRTGDVALALLAYPFGVASARFGRRWPLWVVQVLLSSGTLVTTGGIYMAHGDGAGVAAAFFYLWVALYAAYFFSPRATLLQLGLIAGSYAVVQAVDGGPGAASEWVTTVGAVAVTSLVMVITSRRLRRAVVTDPLTGVANRQHLRDVLPSEIARSRRTGLPLSVAMVDLDHFKLVNDRHGHLEGDRLLAEAASLWQRQLRDIDTLVRYGGDEFAIVLPGSTASEANLVVRRLCDSGTLAASAGIAELEADDTADTLLERADRCLLSAKAERRAAT